MAKEAAQSLTANKPLYATALRNAARERQRWVRMHDVPHLEIRDGDGSTGTRCWPTYPGPDRSSKTNP
jgi:hypothetical protein